MEFVLGSGIVNSRGDHSDPTDHVLFFFFFRVLIPFTSFSHRKTAALEANETARFLSAVNSAQHFYLHPGPDDRLKYILFEFAFL